MSNCSRFIWALMAWAVSVNVLAANFFPLTVPDLITAINTANGNAQNDVIDLGGNTFTLNAVDNVAFGGNGLPVIGADAGNSLTIQNGTIERDLLAPAFRILQVAGGDLSVANLTIRNADADTFQGGAIYVISSGVLASVTNSTFNNNMASEGGAIYILGNINNRNTLISNSTFSGNSAQLVGGAILLNPNLLGEVEIVNSTITQNHAGQDGGGIFYFNTVLTLTSNIIAQNTAGSNGPDIRTLDITPATESFNLIGDDTGSGFTTGSPNINNSFVGTAMSPIDPMLAALANNGGLTQTHALLAGSVAIDSGNNPLALLYDQRGVGYLRVRGTQTDIGAFEVQDCADSDGDGVCDDVDNCINRQNPGQEDEDGDGVGDVCDICPESDDTIDTDGDALPDGCDVCPNDRFNDADDDALCGDVDNCPFKANLDQADADNDGMGDACDTDTCVDADEDNVCDYEDNCLELANEAQADADGDGLGDACDDCPNDRFNDADADGVCGDVDNCPFNANPDQTDTDEDDIGNACDWCPADAGDDNDEDEDGICDAADLCSGHDDALDDDADGIPDDCDNCPFDYNNDQFDIDQDGVGDECDDDVVIVTPPIAPPLAPWPPFAGPVGVGGAGGAGIAEPVAPVAVDRAPATADLPAVEKAPRSNVQVITIDPKELWGERDEQVTYPEDLGGGCSLISGPGQTANNLWMLAVLMSLWLRRRKSA